MYSEKVLKQESNVIRSLFSQGKPGGEGGQGGREERGQFESGETS